MCTVKKLYLSLRQETITMTYALLEKHFGDVELTMWMFTLFNEQNGMK